MLKTLAVKMTGGVIGAEFRALQAGGRRFEPGHVHQNFIPFSCSGLGEPYTAERCDATALHFPFCLTKVSVKIIVVVSGCPLKSPACEALPVTTAASVHNQQNA